jgi:hypothetical protein
VEASASWSNNKPNEKFITCRTWSGGNLRRKNVFPQNIWRVEVKQMEVI